MRLLWRFAGYIMYAVFLLACMELGARAFWKSRGISFTRADQEIYFTFYPEMKRVGPSPCQDCFDILILGASAVNPEYGSVEASLKEEVSFITKRRVRVDNLAMAAQTSLDSYYKYRRLGNKHYDLVVDYDGINEIRTNDWPPELFRNDYSHYSWYKLVNDFENSSGRRRLILPYTLEFGLAAYRNRSDLDRAGPRKQWLDYGCQIKSAVPFRENTERIISIAKAKHEPLLLMTLSYYIAPGYTEVKFRKRELDYARHLYPVEIYGKPACVAAGIDAHSAVIREIAQHDHDVLFVDQDRLIPHEGRYFNDMCHFTARGSQRFVDNMLGTIAKLIKPADLRVPAIAPRSR